LKRFKSIFEEGFVEKLLKAFKINLENERQSKTHLNFLRDFFIRLMTISEAALSSSKSSEKLLKALKSYS
jgi:hypothetical protein